MQLDLFTAKERKGPATVYRFPLHRRAALIRETAAELCARSYDEGKRYWSRHAQKLRRDLRADGLSRAEIESEIKAYAVAVRRAVFASGPSARASR